MNFKSDKNVRKQKNVETYFISIAQKIEYTINLLCIFNLKVYVKTIKQSIPLEQL